MNTGKELTGGTLGREPLASQRPLVMLFVSPECQESRQLAQGLHELAPDYESCLDFVSVDITRDNELAVRFKVFSTPSLVVLLNGVVLYRVAGTLPERELKSMFETACRYNTASTPAADPGNA
jgi:thioredoxin-like negative regulator of GroEL